jgi:hypothetical protein
MFLPKARLYHLSACGKSLTMPSACETRLVRGVPQVMEMGSARPVWQLLPPTRSQAEVSRRSTPPS